MKFLNYAVVCFVLSGLTSAHCANSNDLSVEAKTLVNEIKDNDNFCKFLVRYSKLTDDQQGKVIENIRAIVKGVSNDLVVSENQKHEQVENLFRNNSISSPNALEKFKTEMDDLYKKLSNRQSVSIKDHKNYIEAYEKNIGNVNEKTLEPLYRNQYEASVKKIKELEDVVYHMNHFDPKNNGMSFPVLDSKLSDLTRGEPVLSREINQQVKDIMEKYQRYKSLRKIIITKTKSPADKLSVAEEYKKLAGMFLKAPDKMVEKGLEEAEQQVSQENKSSKILDAIEDYGNSSVPGNY